MIFIIGQGRLKLNHTFATDGVVWFKVFSPRLRRLMTHKTKRDLSTTGTWLAIDSTIVWFKKTAGGASEKFTASLKSRKVGKEKTKGVEP